MKSLNLHAAALIVATLFCAMVEQPALSKEWSIQDRQDELMRQINAGQKAKELTFKEAKRLRGDLADVSRKKKSMRSDDKKPLTAEQKAELEKVLNDISVDINKLKLEKRTHVNPT